MFANNRAPKHCHRLSRLLCLLLCLTLLPFMFPSVVPAAEAAAAPNVRIHLKRLALTDRADLWLDGLYTAGSSSEATIAFPEGSHVILQIRGSDIYLFYEGLSMRLGPTVTFWQNETGSGDYEGIRFSETGNLYPGILTFTVQNGVLFPVLTLSVEDYLLGVVPYEMSDAFPLEALKAQAVCARTYALANIDPSSAYDMVDTTANQVFKGIDPTLTNAIRAVRDTAGVVGTYNNELATCYYAASNGGQTELVEHVWSGLGDWSYYQMVDDPYDLENPESIVRRARLNRDASNLPGEFTEIICNYMASELLSRGFDPLPDCFRIDSIEAIALGSPRFDEPSRTFDEITLTLTWSGRGIVEPVTPAPTQTDYDIILFATATPEPTVDSIFSDPSATVTVTPVPATVYTDYETCPDPFTLTLPLFPEVVRALNLSIYGADNELITLTETDTQFILESRRYGHGVGMSQRGAQWMAAQYGKTFTDILSFYYPGMILKRVQADSMELPTAQPALIETPAPPATPTPRPTLMPVTGELPEGAYLATVANIDDDSSLNLRQEPTTAAPIVMRLYKNQKLVVLETCEDPAWVKVKTDVIEGFVMVSFLAPVE